MMKDNGTPTIRKVEAGRIRALLRDQLQPLILLGAGASIKSGIPSAREIVNRAAKWSWCKEHGRSTEDPSVVISDWQPWLQKQPWFRTNVGLEDQYPLAIKNLLSIATDRREFFQQIISRGVRPSAGYRALAKIMNNGWIATALTTNFDHCLHNAAILEAVPPFIVEIKTPSDWVQFSVAPSDPQLIHIHGSVEHYSAMHLAEEVHKMNPETIEKLRPLLRDHPLIVVGYRGMEASVMTDLLYNQSKYTNKFQHGIFWCDLKRNADEPLAPMVNDLAGHIGANFNRVQIEEFDHLLQVELYDQLVAAKTPHKSLGPPRATIELPPDMRVFDGGTYDDLDQQLLFQRLKQYAKKHFEPVPARFDAEWVAEIADAKKLIMKPAKEGKTARPTLAGWVMFARNPTSAIPHAVVKFRAKGPESWLRAAFGEDADFQPAESESKFVIEREIDGTLWNQLDVLIETTTLLNESFLLKEAKSRSVTAYAPIALREMIVNALVHRDYNKREPITITMTPSQIETTSPGGLIEEVAAKTEGKTIEDFIRGGYRGELKGYRNPVISGLFYDCNEMERRGSGLSDMFQKTIDNNGDVHFRTTEDNEAFHVIIDARPEAVDEITQTAIADQSKIVHFTTNLVEFVLLPNNIWHVGTTSKSMGGLREKAGGLPVPLGYVQNERFFSFYDLSRIVSELETPFDKTDVEELTIEELLDQGNGHNILRGLLNESINEHLRSLGLIVDESQRCAYFPRGDEPNRRITYRGPIKQATRTVVKARTKSRSNNIIYYEHKSLSYSVASFSNDWGLFINPGYVFTRDGRLRYLVREQANNFSTVRAATDFNFEVMHDIRFWIAYMSKENNGVFALQTALDNELSDYEPRILLSSTFSGIAFSSSVFDSGQSIEDEFGDTPSDLDIELENIASRGDDESDDHKENDNTAGRHGSEESKT